jgi:hypothetical protein
MLKNFSGKIISLPLLIIVFLMIQIASAWSANISGTIKIDGKKDKSGVLITIQGRSLSAITDKDGNYSIQNVPSGSYTITAQKPGNISGIKSDVIVGTSNVPVDFQLIPGDLKIDNQINLLDRIMLSSVWKTKVGDVNWNSMMDIFEDGVIDEKDRDLLLSNWRKGNPNVKLGSMSIDSNPLGASIFINGADTGFKTPYTFPGLIVGEYTITLQMKNYASIELRAQIKENQIQVIPTVVLDNQPPDFANWATDPIDLTEDVKGRFQVVVTVTDKGGSGMGDKIPQFDYHIGTNTNYTGYKPMKSLGNNLWSFDIQAPTETWDTYGGKYAYYKVKAEDAAGNSAESAEQQKLIININRPPTARIINAFSLWQKGLLTITAEATDVDGTITGVQFEYSFDNATWTQIGLIITKLPYSVSWDTKTVIKDVMKNVWIRATATDNENASTKYITPTGFGIDNQAPTTSHDYDGLWHNKDFSITLKATDASGIGLSTISYKLNNGSTQDINIDGQVNASVLITKEDSSNVIEYWGTDQLGNEEQHKTLSNIKLDKTLPLFTDWKQDPTDLTEDTKGRFRISVRVTDDGSGLTGKVPQIDYHIGTETQYDGFENMITEDGKTWYSDILEPANTWDFYRGKYLYYKVQCSDVAGNLGVSPDRTELIDNINDPPIVKIINTFTTWQKGVLKIDATASDQDGTVTSVQFEYSLDKANWKPFGASLTSAPYSISWDTVAFIPQAPSVWIRATATDNEKLSATYLYPASIGIDNLPPTTSDDYNDLWHKDDFVITLTANDGNGIGVPAKNIRYKLDNSEERNIQANGQPKITVEGIHQLEYWSIDDLNNTEIHRTVQNIKLDKTPPTFADWTKDPANLTEDSVGSLRISVRVSDGAGSGLTGKIPQIAYHIGKETVYGEYVNMVKGEAKDVWYYDILEPVGKWDNLRGKPLYYKAKIVDVAGNAAETSEQQELIDDINDPPIVKILTTFNAWEKGSLKIDADASDTDGKISNVLFEYGLNKVDWKPIGTAVAFPYSILWDTKASIPQVALIVWIKATVTDDGGLSKEFVITNSFKVDNEPPVTSHNYDGSWQNKNFVISLMATDKNGIGVASISYKLNDAAKQTVPTNGQVGVPVSITTEVTNTLEYWGVDSLGNEETHKLLTDINLDKTPPKFSNWEQVPTDLTEDTVGKLRILVTIIDSESGLTGKIAQIDYHVGANSKYEGYKNMQTEDGKIWYFDIPEPIEKWDPYRGGYVYYKVKVEDAAKNSVESSERKELIDSINDPPVVNLISTFKDWETKEIEIKAVASDPDGSIPSVQFAYSLDNNIWKNIGSPDNTSPYSVIWDTRTDIPNLAKSVWVRVTAIDTDDKTVTVNSDPSRKFGIDNQSPVSGNWTKVPANLTEDTPGIFRVSVEFIDGEGSGVDRAELAYKIGTSNYKNYRDMKRESNNVWYYEIIESGGWDQYRGLTLYYKARATDLVGNVSPETNEQLELIDDINDPPTGLITTTFKDWEKGSIIIQANASDQDGIVKTVQFQSSVDNTKWVDIGSQLTKTPYSVTYDSTVIDVDPHVWIKALVTDDGGAVTELLISKSFGVDNKPPDLANWKLVPENLTESSKESSFRVEVEVTDQGSGVDETRIQLNYKIANGKYSEYQTMYKESGNRWFLEIPKPIGNWSSYAGQKVFYRVKALDKAGNIIESEERSELIDPTTGVVSGSINPRESWRVAKVAIQLNAQTITEIAVSQIDGTYSIPGLSAGLYNLQVSAIGFGTDKSKTNVEVKVGTVTTVPIVELWTYSVETIGRSQGGKVDFRDADIKDYSIAVEANTFTKDAKVVLGFGGSGDSAPTSIPNPTVRVLGRSIGVGFEGKDLLRPLKLTLPRPDGITDAKSIMLFIYNGIDYRMINRNDILTNEKTITAYVIPPDILNFSDPNHRFDRVLSKTADTVFYVIITKFDEPVISTSDLGVRNPVLSTDFSKISVYAQPTITSLNRKIALVMHGVTSKADDMVYIIKDLRSLTPTNSSSPYYDQVLIFNYDSGTQLISNNSSFLVSELGKVLTNFSGKIDVIAHDSGALVARHAITARGMDQFLGSLIMLAAPHGGINADLLKAGFNSFLKKTQSDPIWTYYRDGWQEIFENTTSLGALNNQPGRKVNTHYYGISASDPGVTNDLDNNDGLVYVKNVDYTNNGTFPFIEQGLSELYEKVNIIPPTFEGKGFMSLTRHLAILSSDVRIKIMTYLRGKSENINVVQNDIDLMPGNRVEDFKVILKNIGTETVFGVSAQISTTNQYIRKFNGQQGIEKDNTVYGDMLANQTTTGSFKFDVSPTATSAIGQPVTFTLVIRNSKDNSITIKEFNAPIGGNLIRIALDAQQKQIFLADANKDTDRPLNDGDIAIEPGEIMKINITLENRSASSISSVKAVLKTDDARVKGLVGTTEVNMATDGITIDYGSMAGTGKTAKDYKYIKLLIDPTLLGSQINFTLDIKSGVDTIGRDTFSVKTGASIVVQRFEPDTRLIPGGIARPIEVDIRNTTSTDLSDIEVTITPNVDEFRLAEDIAILDLLRAIDTKQLDYSATIDAGFAGYVTFTVEIKVNNTVVNKETFKQYFGKRTQYVLDWITTDNNSNAIAEPGELIRLQMARMNPTNETANNVDAVLATTDPAITITRSNPGYNDILTGETKPAGSEYRFTVAQDVAVASPSGSTLTETTLTVLPSPNWTGGAFIGRFLNPNTTSGDTQYLFRITGNGPNSITVATTATSNLLDPNNNGITAADPQNGDPFQVIRPLGQPVQFTLKIEEDGEELGEEVYNTRIGGIIRYLPPAGYDAFKVTIDDSKTMSLTNNPNGIPEPGEKIGITITLINIGPTSLTNVTAVLNSGENDVDISTDEGNYGSMSSSGTSKKKTAKFIFTIDRNTTMNKLLFRLDIEGDINTTNTYVNLGTDYFYIPVKRQL